MALIDPSVLNTLTFSGSVVGCSMVSDPKGAGKTATGVSGALNVAQKDSFVARTTGANLGQSGSHYI